MSQMTGIGDYDLRGPDFETMLVGAVTATIIDADREVRRDWSNGFPNWAMYRTALAGDTHLRLPLRAWLVAYAIAYAETINRKGQPVEEIGCLAGWDAYYRLLNHRWVIAGQDVADVAGVDPKTYRKVRNYVYMAARASMGEYWIRMQVAIRQVAMRERMEEHTSRASTYGSGRGFDGDMGVSASGNLIAPKRGPAY